MMKKVFHNLLYSQLPLRQTRSGPAPTVHLGEASAFEGDEVNTEVQLCTQGDTEL